MLRMDTYKQFHLIGLKVFVLKGNLISSITSASLLQPLCEGVLCVYPQPNPLWTFSYVAMGATYRPLVRIVFSINQSFAT